MGEAGVSIDTPLYADYSDSPAASKASWRLKNNSKRVSVPLRTVRRLPPASVILTP